MTKISHVIDLVPVCVIARATVCGRSRAQPAMLFATIRRCSSKRDMSSTLLYLSSTLLYSSTYGVYFDHERIFQSCHFFHLNKLNVLAAFLSEYLFVTTLQDVDN